MTTTTWKPHTVRQDLTSARTRPPARVGVRVPRERKEPLVDAGHVRNALARFDQVEDVTDAEREQAFANIKKAAGHYGVEVTAERWQELGKP